MDASEPVVSRMTAPENSVVAGGKLVKPEPPPTKLPADTEPVPVMLFVPIANVPVMVPPAFGNATNATLEVAVMMVV